MSGSSFVFLDPNGKRWRWVRAGVALAIVALISLLVVFIQALWVRPELRMPDSLRTMKLQLKAQAKPSLRAVAAEKPWAKFQPTRPRPPKANPEPKPGLPVAAALLAGWDTRSLQALSEHSSQLTHVCPEMMTIEGQPASLHVDYDTNVLTAVRASRLQLIPVLSNLSSNQWDTDAVEGLLQADEATQQLFIDKVLAALKKVGASGVLLDWQGIDPTYADRLVKFLGRMRSTLQDEAMELWLDIPVGEDLHAFDLDHLPGVVDHLIAQLHDENAEGDAPGPVASQPWFEGWLRTLLGYGEPGQWVFSLGSYGYDWNTTSGGARAISFPDAMARAQRSGADPVTSAGPDYSPGFSYDAEGQSHEVWFLDAATFANQLRTVGREGAAGFVLNRLGTEDPGVWQVLAHPPASSHHHLRELETIEPGSVIAQIGEGDFLSADLTSLPGERQLWFDEDGSIGATYKKWPVYPTVAHLGKGLPNEVCLTFDDGPDPHWTPRILDILKQRNVKATFFVLGKHAEEHPELITRILREGHEIGSHTYTHPNLSEAGDEKTTLELNATQRLLEWISGRSTILFRPPYNADAMPASLEDVQPIALASDLGYLTVGESVDTQDWQRPGADEIVRRVRDQRANGNVILLHDAGGDRSQTVEALPRILDYLEARGDVVVPSGKLIGLTPAQTMPAIEANGPKSSRVITNAGLFVLHWAEDFLWAFMIVSSILTLLRSVAIAGLALLRRRKVVHSVPPYAPPLSVVIAAYNEEKVITATLRSVLKTDYTGEVEVIVVDDGSTDGTSAQVTDFGDPRVRLIRQANGGKSSALANGTAAAKHEVLVFLDADTQFQPDTLGELVRPMEDSHVGAVSGHARVGNLRTWVARFQSLEYICGFNLDRRAYDRINAITVVPGAISAFRREAIRDAGGFASNTIAEDTDLTLSLHRTGWKVTYAPDAVAWTEAPESIRTLAKQRLRWAFGTMQCLWKHRDLILNPRFGGLGCFSLPSIVLFQIVLVAAVPIVDVLLIISLFFGAGQLFVAYFLAFLLCDLFLALIACWIEEESLLQAIWVIPMRFVYRPVLSYVVWSSIFRILRGAWVGWGKLERSGTVALPAMGS